MNIEQKIDRLVTSAYNSHDRQKVDEIEFRSSLLRLANTSKVDIPALVGKIKELILEHTEGYDNGLCNQVERVLTESLSDKKKLPID